MPHVPPTKIKIDAATFNRVSPSAARDLHKKRLDEQREKEHIAASRVEVKPLPSPSAPTTPERSQTPALLAFQAQQTQLLAKIESLTRSRHGYTTEEKLAGLPLADLNRAGEERVKLDALRRGAISSGLIESEATGIFKPIIPPEFAEEVGRKLPSIAGDIAGPILGAAAELTTPFDIATIVGIAKLGAPISAALRGTGTLIGRGIANVIQPLASSFGRAAAAEVAIGTGAVLAATKTGEALEDSPTPIRIAGSIGAGLIGGIAVIASPALTRKIVVSIPPLDFITGSASSVGKKIRDGTVEFNAAVGQYVEKPPFKIPTLKELRQAGGEITYADIGIDPKDVGFPRLPKDATIVDNTFGTRRVDSQRTSLELILSKDPNVSVAAAARRVANTIHRGVDPEFGEDLIDFSGMTVDDYIGDSETLDWAIGHALGSNFNKDELILDALPKIRAGAERLVSDAQKQLSKLDELDLAVDELLLERGAKALNFDIEKQRGFIGVPPLRNLFGKTPADNWVEQGSAKLVGDDMLPLAPETRLTNPHKNKYFGDQGVELTDDDRLVWRHLNVQPRTRAGKFEPGMIQDVAKQLDDLEILTLEDRLTVSAAGAVRQAKTVYGVRYANNIRLLFAQGDDVIRQVDSQLSTTYSRSLQAFAKIPAVGDMTIWAFRERFPRALHIASIRYDNFMSSAQHAIGNAFFHLHNDFDDVLRNTEFTITENPRVVKTKGVVTGEAGRVTSAFGVIDNNIKGGVYSAEQGQALKLGIMFQEKDAFQLTQKQDDMIRRIGNIMSDNLNFEVLSGAFRGDAAALARAKEYLPQIWKFKGNLLDAEGRLTDAGFERIFGTKQFFEKSRTWPSIADAVIQVNKADDVIRLADEIENPLDLIAARLMGSARIMGDKYLNDFVDAAVKAGDVSTTDAINFRSIKGGGSGAERNTLEKVVSGVVDISLAPPLRVIRFSYDIGALGVQATPSINYLAANPLKTIKMWEVAFRYFLTPQGFRQWKAANPERWARAARAGLLTGQEILQKAEGGEWIEKMPTFRRTGANVLGVPVIRPGLTPSHKFLGKNIYNPVKLSNEAQFSRAMAIIKIMAFEIESDILWSNSVWNKINRSVGLAPKRQVKSRLEADLVAAAASNERFGGIGNTRALQSKAMRKALTGIILTPDFAQATMASTLRPWVTPQTAEATLARAFWVRLFVVMGSLGMALEESGVVGEVNLTRPDKPDWFIAEFAKDKWNILGRFNTHFKLLAAISDDVSNAFSGDLPRDTGNDVDLKALNAVQRLDSFISGRLSVPLELRERLTSQLDFRGQPFWDEDLDPAIKDYLGYVLTHGPVPISVRQYLDDKKDNQVTQLGITSYIFGFAQYPIDIERERAKDALVDALAEEIHQSTGGRITGDDAFNLAKIAATERQTTFGNRIRPDQIIDPNTGVRIDLDMDNVYTRMAWSLDYTIERTSGKEEPDTERARLLGDTGNLSPKQRQEQERFLKKVAIEDFDRIQRQRRDQTDAVEAEYGPGKQYPTFRSALRRIGQLQTAFRASGKNVDMEYGELLDKLKDKRISETEQTRAFDTIRSILDATVNDDGSVDHWTRTRRLDELEDTLSTDLVDKFFEHDASKNETWLLRTWRAASAAASTYYEVPAKALNRAQYDLWREWELVNDDKAERAAWVQRNGVDRAILATQFDNRIKLIRRSRTLAAADAVAQEVALWLLDGRRPRNPETQALFRYHTGSVRPSPTEFSNVVDTETLLSILGEDLTNP